MNLDNAQEYLVKRIKPGRPYGEFLNFPSYLEVETINACNARCPMCTIADWERGAKPMTDDLFAKIADELIEHASEIERVSLYRDGEPLIDKGLADRVAMLKEGGIKNTHISTNVSLLTEEKSKDLLTAGLDTIILSIDSLQKEVYEKIRVRLVMEDVLENALKFIEQRNKIRPQTKITVRMIRQEGNENEWPEFNAYWLDKLAEHDRVYFRNVYNWGGQLKGFSPLSLSYEPNLPCVALWSLMVIFCNGDVPLCNVDFNNKFSNGSVITHSIQELWQSKTMNERRDWHLAGDKAKISICQNCNVWDEPPDGDGVSQEFADEVELTV